MKYNFSAEYDSAAPKKKRKDSSRVALFYLQYFFILGGQSDLGFIPILLVLTCL